MKKIAVLALLIFMQVGALAAVKAQQIDILAAGIAQAQNGTVYVYQAGTTTLADVWDDRDKTTAADNPKTLDANGRALMFADGSVKLLVQDSEGSTVTGFPMDEVNYFYPSSVVAATNQINAADGDGIKILDDGDNQGIFVKDGGFVAIHEDTNPLSALSVANAGTTTYATTLSVTTNDSDVLRVRNTSSSGDYVSIQMEAGSDQGIARIIAEKASTDETDFYIHLKDASAATITQQQFKLTSEGDLTIGGDLTISGTLSGATAISGALVVSNNLTVTGNLAVTGTSTHTGAMTVNNDLTVTGNLAVTGTQSFTGGATFSGVVTVNNNLVVTGNGVFTGTLTANTNETINGIDINSGAISDVTTLGLSGAITGATNETINGIDINSGAVSDVTDLTISGTFTDGTASLVGGALTSLTNLTVDNLQADGNTISSTTGDLNLTPLAGEDVVIDTHFEFDGTTMTALTDADTSIVAYAGKAIVLDGHLDIDGPVVTALTDNDTTITAYAGKGIVVESVDFDGGVVTGVTDLTGSGTIQGGTITDGTASLSSGAITSLSSLNTISSTELSQLTNIDSSTISTTQWGYLGGFDQDLQVADSVQFASITDGTATLTSGGISGLTNVNSVTATELSQLETIGATTISAGQWGYLGAMDQAVDTAQNVTFVTGNFTGGLVVDTNTLFVDSLDNNVGIGTASPEEKGHINGNLKLGTAAAGSTALKFGVNAGIDYHLITYSDSTGDLVFTSDNGNRDVVFNGGNVGIGTASPAYQLHIKNTADSARMQLETTDTNASTILYMTSNGTGVNQIQYQNGPIRFYDDTGVKMIIQQGGNVGIGTTDPTRDLSVSGDIKAETLESTGDTAVGGFLNLGTFTELTISGGVVTASRSYHSIDTESDSGTDDLDTINGGTSGDILIIRPASGDRTIVVKHGTGNILCGGSDVTMDDVEQMTLVYDGTNWRILSFTETT